MQTCSHRQQLPKLIKLNHGGNGKEVGYREQGDRVQGCREKGDTRQPVKLKIRRSLNLARTFAKLDPKKRIWRLVSEHELYLQRPVMTLTWTALPSTWRLTTVVAMVLGVTAQSVHPVTALQERV